MTRVWGLGWDGFIHPEQKPEKLEPWVRAIAIKQPMAWAIIYGGKDIENRSKAAARAYRPAHSKRVFVHASKTMTKAEFADAVEFMRGLGIEPPPLDELEFGGIIGSVLVERIVKQHDSRWFSGPAALVLADPRPEPFRPMRGRVGLFRVQP